MTQHLAALAGLAFVVAACSPSRDARPSQSGSLANPPPGETVQAEGRPVPPGPGQPLLHWEEFKGQWGTETITVDSNGITELRFESANPAYPARNGRGRLSPPELSDLTDRMRQSPWCDTQSQGTPQPGESQPSLTLWLAGTPCTITLLKSEFPTRVTPLYEVLERLRTSL